MFFDGPRRTICSEIFVVTFSNCTQLKTKRHLDIVIFDAFFIFLSIINFYDIFIVLGIIYFDYVFIFLSNIYFYDIFIFLSNIYFDYIFNLQYMYDKYDDRGSGSETSPHKGWYMVHGRGGAGPPPRGLRGIVG